MENSFTQSSLYVKTTDFHLFHLFLLNSQTEWEKMYVSLFTVLFFLNRTHQQLRSTEIMAFIIWFVPLKEVSFPEDPFPLLFKLLDDEVIKEEKLGRGSFHFTYKARFKGETVAIKEFTRNKWDETGKTYLKEAKILKSLNHPNVKNFKNVFYQPLAIMFPVLNSFSN